MGTIIVCDFDGTIVNVDTGELILSRFADGDWRALDELYHRNEMTSEEVIRRQFSMVKVSKASLIEAIQGTVLIRPGFDRLLRVCGRRRVPFFIVSYGLDFCIRRFLVKASQRGYVRICAPRARVTPNGISFTFPRRRLKGSVNMKEDLVRYLKGRGHRVLYVGDSTSDFPAAASADVRFAIKGSRLAEFCARNGIHCSQITSFDPVTASIEGIATP